MHSKIFANEHVALKFKAKVLQFAVVVIAVSNIFFGFLAYKAVKQKQVVFYPVGYCGQFSVGLEKPSEEYIYAMAQFIAHSLLTYTPQNVRKQYAVVLTLFDSSVQNHFRKVFEDFIDSAETANLSSVFHIEKIQHNPEKQIIVIEGVQSQFMGDEVVETKRQKYYIKYKYDYGTFRIADLKKEVK